MQILLPMTSNCPNFDVKQTISQCSQQLLQIKHSFHLFWSTLAAISRINWLYLRTHDHSKYQPGHLHRHQVINIFIIVRRVNFNFNCRSQFKRQDFPLDKCISSISIYDKGSETTEMVLALISARFCYGFAVLFARLLILISNLKRHRAITECMEFDED